MYFTTAISIALYIYGNLVFTGAADERKEEESLLCMINDLRRDISQLRQDDKKMKIKQNVDIKQIKLQHEEDIRQLVLDQKTEISTLRQSQRNETEKLKADLKILKAKLQQQKYSLVEVKTKVSTISSHCQLIPQTCGPCTCVDDYQLADKYYCSCTHLKAKMDCLEFYQNGHRINGLYNINVRKNVIQVFCDLTTDGGGWTVIQRRINGHTNFYHNWKTYKVGFGNLHREFYLGNDNIYLLSVIGAYPNSTELRIDMANWKEKKYAKYTTFFIGNEDSKYMLTAKGYSGNCGDSFTYHSGMKFSTYDEDNDVSSWNCAKAAHGAWWYNACYRSNLNGEYLQLDDVRPSGDRNIRWTTGFVSKSLKSIEMKIRRRI